MLVFELGIRDCVPLFMKHGRKLTFRKPGAGSAGSRGGCTSLGNVRYNGATQPISVHQTAERQLGSFNANVFRLQQRALGRSWKDSSYMSKGL